MLLVIGKGTEFLHHVEAMDAWALLLPREQCKSTLLSLFISVCLSVSLLCPSRVNLSQFLFAEGRLEGSGETWLGVGADRRKDRDMLAAGSSTTRSEGLAWPSLRALKTLQMGSDEPWAKVQCGPYIVKAQRIFLELR